MKRLGSPLALSSCVVLLALAGSCSAEGSPYDGVPWACFADATSCTCFGGTRAEEKTDARPATQACAAALDCCFVIHHGAEAFDCICIETPPEESDSDGARVSSAGAGSGGEGDAAPGRSPAARCTRAATDYDTTDVVGHCPPVTLDSSAVCSAIFESCDARYLKNNGLIACCDGLSCEEDANGQLVCVESGDEDS